MTLGWITVLLLLGYHGNSCNSTCPEGTYGEDCSLICKCNNGAKCSPETGKCLCPAGWRGQQCDLPCENSYFGENCKNECQCENDAACSPVDGKYQLEIYFNFNKYLFFKH